MRVATAGLGNPIKSLSLFGTPHEMREVSLGLTLASAPKGGDCAMMLSSLRVGFMNCRHRIGVPMSGLSHRLKQLDEELLALGEEVMLLDELDGFIAGLLACPELISPNEASNRLEQ